MPALKECAVRHGAHRPCGNQARPPLRIIVLDQGQDPYPGRRHGTDRRLGVVGAGGGVDRHQVSGGGGLGDKGGDQGCWRCESLNFGAEGAPLPFESGGPDEIVGQHQEARRGHSTVQVSPEARSFCRSTGPFAARAAFAPSICSTRS